MSHHFSFSPLMIESVCYSLSFDVLVKHGRERKRIRFSFSIKKERRNVSLKKWSLEQIYYIIYPLVYLTEERQFIFFTVIWVHYLKYQ
jgi:hypothetical protein